MATVIDSLIVELGLDASNFSKEQKKALAEANKAAKDQVKAAKEQERAVTDAMNKIKISVLSMFAAFTAGRGLKDFLADVTVVNAETGRLARNLDMTTSTLSAWQGAAVLAGGSASGMAGSIQNLQSQMQTFFLTGESSVLPYFRALGVATVDTSGRIRNMSDILLDLSDRFKGMDPARAQAFGRALGLDQGTVNVLMEGRTAVKAMLADQVRLGIITREDAAAGAQLQKAWLSLLQASTSLGRVIVTWLSPALSKLADVLTSVAVWARAHGPFIKAVFIGLSAAATAFTVALGSAFAPILGLVAAIGLAVTAIALLYDDWRTWTEGGKSQFGAFYEYVADKWNSLKGVVLPVIEALKKYVADLFEFWKSEFAAIVSLFSGNAEEIRAAWGKMFDDLKKLLWDFVDVVKKAGPAILEAFKIAFTGAFDWLKSRFNAIWGAVFGRKLFDDATGAEGAGGTGGGAGGAAPGTSRGGVGRPNMRYGPGGRTPAGRGGAIPAVPDNVPMTAAEKNTLGLIMEHESHGKNTMNYVGRSQGLDPNTAKGATAQGYYQILNSNWRRIAPGLGITTSNAMSSTLEEQTKVALALLRSGRDRAGGGVRNWTNYNPSLRAAISRGDTSRAGFTPPEVAPSGGKTDPSSKSALGSAAGKWLRNQPMTSQPGLLSAVPMARDASVGAGTQNTNNSYSTQAHIGQVNVHTQAVDATGIAKDMVGATQRAYGAAQANYGMN